MPLAVWSVVLLSVAVLAPLVVRTYIRRRGGAGVIMRSVPSVLIQWSLPTRPALEPFPPSEEPGVSLPGNGGLGPYYIHTLPGFGRPDQLRRSGLLVAACPDDDLRWTPVRVRHPSGKPVVSPITIALVGLSDWSEWCRSADERSLSYARSAAKWLVETQMPDGSWRFAHEWQEMRAGWASAMAQGLAISLLIRLWELRNESAFLAAARRAKTFMLTSVEQGGVLAHHTSGARILEEYPGARYTRHVLNGAVYALLGLRDLAHMTGDPRPEWRRLADELAGVLPHYDTGGWSRYALPSTGLRKPVGPFYHALHIAQLDVMAHLHDSDRWATWSRIWAADLSEWRRGIRIPETGPRVLQIEPTGRRRTPLGTRDDE